MMEPKVFSVRQINRYIKSMFENDFILNSLWVKGEISNFKAHSSGHLYFTLKDATASIQCVMFRGSADILPFLPQNGMSVILCGYVSTYEKTGQYQLYAELMEPVGLGSLHLAFEQLKEKLGEEGLFDEDYKRELIPSPKCIAVITSPTGAAVRDVIQITRRRNKMVKIVVAPVLVQGENAADSIVSAIKMVNQWGKADTIILGRGGGSAEDLWAFNEEKVARAIFGSEIPIISAVGHETDVTISDFVADLRAPTPSAAAELATEDLSETYLYLEDLFRRMNGRVMAQLSDGKNRLESLLGRPVLKRPLERLQNYEVYMENLKKQLEKEMVYQFEKIKARHRALQDRLDAGSPLSVLRRGYMFGADEDGQRVTTIQDVVVGSQLTLQLKDGQVKAIVKERLVLGNGKEEN